MTKHSPLVCALFSCALLVACSDSTSQPRLSMLSNGPDLPEECDQCWESFKNCFADGEASADCEEQIIDCVQACKAPPPPPQCEHCAAGYEACVDFAEAHGDSAEDCAAGIEGCLAACAGGSGGGCEDNTDPDAAGECHVDPECGECKARLEDCYQDVPDADVGGTDVNGDGEADQGWNCQELAEECRMICEPPPPPNPCELCDDARKACEQGSDGVEGPDGELHACDDLEFLCPDDCQQTDPPVVDCDVCRQCSESGDLLGDGDCASILEVCIQQCGPC